ncbi:hypothetical protein WA588_001626 [Blastocystis sp. NMH]
MEEEPGETKEQKVKRKKTKKRQFFRRVYLKKQKQIRNTLHPTPSSFQISSIESEPFSRKMHDIRVQNYQNQEDNSELIISGKTKEELEQLDLSQRQRIGELEKQNDQLSLMIYRLKKQLRHIASM